MTEKNISAVKRIAAAGVAAATVFASSVGVSAAELPMLGSAAITENFTEAIRAAKERIALGQAREVTGDHVEKVTIPEYLAEAYPTVFIDGVKYEGFAFISQATTYVALSEITYALGADSVTYGDTVVVNENGNELEYVPGEGNYSLNGELFVPIRGISQLFGYNVSWSGARMEIYVTTPAPHTYEPEKEYDEESLYWLSRIIEAEAGCESFEGKLAVGNVVLNRVNSSMFPNTVYGVIFDFSCGVQFTPAANGTVYNTPSADSVEAAKQCLDGKNVVGNALFFMNGAIAQSAWISNNRTYIMTIGNHQFYA